MCGGGGRGVGQNEYFQQKIKNKLLSIQTLARLLESPHVHANVVGLGIQQTSNAARPYRP